MASASHVNQKSKGRTCVKGQRENVLEGMREVGAESQSEGLFHTGPSSAVRGRGGEGRFYIGEGSERGAGKMGVGHFPTFLDKVCELGWGC